MQGHLVSTDKIHKMKTASIMQNKSASLRYKKLYNDDASLWKQSI